MNFKLIFKTLFVIVVLALLVVLGRSNPDPVALRMPVLSHPFKLEAGYMYYGFFAVGFLCGTVLMSGGKKGGGGASKSSKVQT
ncbi:MAG TPA: hypothetical protein VGO59_12080 [Verrucomicrobiae bacterium]|jgi:preprotein translocase subunit SecG